MSEDIRQFVEINSQDPNPEISKHYIELKVPLGSQSNSPGNYSSQIKRLSAASLAYVGDAVYELYVRTYFLLPPKRNANYHAEVVEQVRAEGQVSWLEKLKPYLTETEQDIVRWGRNAASGGPRRISLALYQEASSLETLIGYLYLNDTDRLLELLLKLDFNTKVDYE